MQVLIAEDALVIEVESTPGRGSLLRVRLPLQPPRQA